MKLEVIVVRSVARFCIFSFTMHLTPTHSVCKLLYIQFL